MKFLTFLTNLKRIKNIKNGVNFKSLASLADLSKIKDFARRLLKIKINMKVLRPKIIFFATAFAILSTSGWVAWKIFFPEEAEQVSEERDDRAWAPLSVTDDALFQAVRRGDAEAVYTCVLAGGDPHATNKGGVTPLRAAIALGRGDIVREFVRADVKGTAENWAAALVYAVVQNRPGIVREISARPSLNLNAPDKNGVTPLRYAIDRNLTATAKELLDAGADPNAAGRDGLPPVIAAVYRGKRDMVAELLKAGADWKVPAPDGETAMGIASRMKRGAVIYALLYEAENPPENMYEEYMKLPPEQGA